jgi:hypothetical protein
LSSLFFYEKGERENVTTSKELVSLTFFFSSTYKLKGVIMLKSFFVIATLLSLSILIFNAGYDVFTNQNAFVQIGLGVAIIFAILVCACLIPLYIIICNEKFKLLVFDTLKNKTFIDSLYNLWLSRKFEGSKSK